MKKFLIILLVLLPIIVSAEDCNDNNITIESIKVENKSENVKEINSATVDGKNINLDLSMSDVGDSIKYRILVKNDSNDDYELNKKSFNISSDYIDYSIDTDNKSNIVKAKSSKTVYLNVEYKNKVEDEKFNS